MDLERFLERAERLLERAERFLPPEAASPDWERTHAARWRPAPGNRGRLEAVARPHAVDLADLRGVDPQKARLDANTRQFVRGLPANNALLWGARGTGKSSLVKALLGAYAHAGLRLVEVDRADLVHLPDIVEAIAGRPERFLVFCDDLSFEADDASYKALKVVLDGSVAAAPDNVLVYATTNRRHLVPQYMAENREARLEDGEIRPGDSIEEKTSLSERFGLWLSFYPFDQDGYLAIVEHWLERFGLPLDDAIRAEALRWATARGSRSGRVAWQFARDLAGRRALDEEP